jgi:FkbM family methyltransferase
MNRREVALGVSRFIANSRGPVSSVIYKLACIYMRAHKNLNYDMNTNGEFALLNRLSDQNIKTIFDVGANVGDYSRECLSRFPAATIHSFEIVPATFQKLERNLAESPRVKLNDFGLFNSRGTVQINCNPANDCISSIIEGDAIYKGNWRKLDVKVVVGDDYFNEKGLSVIDLLKIDVEGAEHLVLDGFRKAFEQGKILSVQFEFGMFNIYSKFLLIDYWKFFTEYGFALGPIMPDGVDF